MRRKSKTYRYAYTKRQTLDSFCNYLTSITSTTVKRSTIRHLFSKEGFKFASKRMQGSAEIYGKTVFYLEMGECNISEPAFYSLSCYGGVSLFFQEIYKSPCLKSQSEERCCFYKCIS